MKRNNIYILTLFLCVSIGKVNADYLTFDDLANQEKVATNINTSVQMRGFLYRRDSDGLWILASQPNIRSCCLGRFAQKISLQGLFSDTDEQRLVEVEGRLIFLSDGTYALDSVSLHDRQHRTPKATLIGIGLILSVAVLIIARKRFSNSSPQSRREC